MRSAIPSNSLDDNSPGLEQQGKAGSENRNAHLRIKRQGRTGERDVRKILPITHGKAPQRSGHETLVQRQQRGRNRIDWQPSVIIG